METFLDLLLAGSINGLQAYWDTSSSSEKFSNYLSYTVLVIIALLLPLFAIFYSCKFSSLRNATSRNRYGAFLEGTSFDTEEPSKWILVYPIFFFGRRIALVASILFF
jgi:hypothetical protein